MTTSTKAQEMYNAYLEAEQQILLNQSATVNGKSVTLANLSEVRAGREYWEKKLAALSGKRRVRTVFLEGRS